jgi:hypothetical protein
MCAETGGGRLGLPAPSTTAEYHMSRGICKCILNCKALRPPGQEAH